MTRALAVMALVAAVASPARADAESEHRRITLTINAPLLLAGVAELNTEVAIDPKWSVSLHAGGGESPINSSAIAQVGSQGTYYLLGDVSRGLQVGLDARYVYFEDGGMLLGLGDGFAAGPFVGYKRTYGSGLTLLAQLGGQVAISGRSDGRVLPYLALSAGWAFLRAGPEQIEVSDEPAEAPPPRDPTRSTLDDHDGLLFSMALGGGSAWISGCDNCGLEPGLALHGSLGWFVHRRVAIVVDSSATTALFSLSSGFGSFGFGLTGVGAQYWPHPKLWVKGAVGVAQLASAGVGGPGFGVEVGGGMSLAGGWEFHQEGRFAMDAQLRLSHGSFDEAEELEGVDSLVALVGLAWY